jgi:DNA polymerase-1
MRNAAIAQRSYEYGWAVDPKRTATVTTELETEIQKQEALLIAAVAATGFKPTPTKSTSKKKRAAGIPFNPRSGGHLSEFFYDFLKEPISVRTSEGAGATGKEAVQALKTYGLDPQTRAVAGIIETWKPMVTLRDHFLAKLAGVDLVRPKANVSAQLSGRWSYTDPPLQTTPPKVRPIFVPRPGKVIVTADWSAVEARIAAQLSKDMKLCAAFMDDTDVHILNAVDLFSVPYDEAKEDRFRQPAKTFLYAYLYGAIEADVLAKSIHPKLAIRNSAVTYAATLAAVRRWEETHPEMAARKISARDSAIACGYAEECLSGRRRYFYGQVKAEEAINFPIQAMAAALMDRAVAAVDAALDHTKEGLLLQCHDALYIECSDPVRGIEILESAMLQEHTIGGVTMRYDVDACVYPVAWNDKKTAIKIKKAPHEKALAEAAHRLCR